MNMGMADSEYHEKAARTQRLNEEKLAEAARTQRLNEEKLAEHEIVANDEPSMEDYPTVDEFGAPIKPVVKVRDGVRDTEDRSTRRRA